MPPRVMSLRAVPNSTLLSLHPLQSKQTLDELNANYHHHTLNLNKPLRMNYVMMPPYKTTYNKLYMECIKFQKTFELAIKKLNEGELEKEALVVSGVT